MSQVKVKFIIGLCKPERFELILQKCTELGAFDFTPVVTERVQGAKMLIHQIKDYYDGEK